MNLATLVGLICMIDLLLLLTSSRASQHVLLQNDSEGAIRMHNPWESETKSGLVSIGTHKLFVSTSGIPRLPGTPVVIFFTGCGVPVVAHVRLQSLLSKFARVYFYDRAGYDRSEKGSIAEPKPADAAYELMLLLEAIQVRPPYVLLAHSCGSLMAREFLAANSDMVVGMVLADTGTELTYELFPHIPSRDLEAVAEDVDWEKLTHLREESKLSDQEWQAALQGTARTQKAAKSENIRDGAKALAGLRQLTTQPLGNAPLSVLRADFAGQSQLLYDAGVKLGNGTEEQRAGARKYIQKLDFFADELSYAQLRLTQGDTRYNYIAGLWHDFPIRKPEVILKEVKWVLDRIPT